MDESGAELGGRGSTHVQRCREWVEMAPPAAARATTDCAGMLFMSLPAAAWLQHPMNAARLCEGASGRAWRLTPARHCASCASTSVEVDASRSERITEMPEPAFADMIPRPESSVSGAVAPKRKTGHGEI